MALLLIFACLPYQHGHSHLKGQFCLPLIGRKPADSAVCPLGHEHWSDGSLHTLVHAYLCTSAVGHCWPLNWIVPLSWRVRDTNLSHLDQDPNWGRTNANGDVPAPSQWHLGAPVPPGLAVHDPGVSLLSGTQGDWAELQAALLWGQSVQ